MIKKNFLASTLALSAIVCCNSAAFAATSAPSSENAQMAKIKSEIDKKDYATALQELQPLAEQGEKVLSITLLSCI